MGVQLFAGKYFKVAKGKSLKWALKFNVSHVLVCGCEQNNLEL